MELYIIRHGQSTNNASMIADPNDRVSDAPLTDLGHQQAERVAQHLMDGYNPDLVTDNLNKQNGDARNLRGFGITKLYCSPMHRTLQTTLPIARATGLTPHVWVDIHEHGGLYLEYTDERGIVSFPGKTRADILADFPNYVIPETITEEGWWTGGMEDITNAYGRAVRVAEKLREEAKESPDECVALVTHGTFIDALLKALFNQLPSRNLWYFHYNTAMTRIDFRPNGMLFFRYLNRVDHLTAAMISS